jgi:NhaP-type Na+/H+ or K+/H+ antiporter
MGVGAVDLSIVAREELETAYKGKNISTQLVSPIVLFIVVTSVAIHGCTTR